MRIHTAILATGMLLSALGCAVAKKAPAPSSARDEAPPAPPARPDDGDVAVEEHATPPAPRAADGITLAGGRAVATFHSIGVYVDCAGDVPDDATCHVRLRARGATEWRRGLDLFYCRDDQQFRGSLLQLEPGTPYEIECYLDETPRGDAPARSVRTDTHTWSDEDVPVAEVRTLPERSTEPLTIRDKGTAAGWIVYRPPPGATALLEAGTAATAAVTFEDAAFVVIEHAVLRGGAKDCVSVAKSHDIRVRHCDIAGWGDPGTWDPKLKGGCYVDARGRRINYHAGVHVRDGSTRVVIEHNFIHAPRGTANAWSYGHPAGPQGVVLHTTGGNNVVRYNDIVGSDAHWWNDAIESISNRNVNGGPYRDTDIYGNVLAFENDDGVELDGGQINVRFWHNWITRALCGISHAPNVKGPSYSFRNIIAGLGEENSSAGSAFKMGGGARYSPGMNVILHNTVWGPGGGLCSVGYGDGKDRGAYLAFSRNNLFNAARTDRCVTNVSTDPRNDFDCDLFLPGGARLPDGNEAHAVVGAPRVVDARRGDFRPATGSIALDRACRLPGVNDRFDGRGPDIGAIEAGPGGRFAFPLRPSGLEAAPMIVNVRQPFGGKPSGGTVTVRAPSKSGATWSAHPNSPWLQCEPSRGRCTGEPQRITVRFAGRDPELRTHRGAVTFRTDRGYARTVMVDMKILPARPFRLGVEAEDGELSGAMRLLDDESASGGRCVRTPEPSAAGQVRFAFTVPEEGVYYVAGLCHVPGPADKTGVHDSFTFSVDGAKNDIWDIRIGMDAWQWHLMRGRAARGPAALRLAAGRHTLVIGTREALTGLDRIVIMNAPYLEDAASE